MTQKRSRLNHTVIPCHMKITHLAEAWSKDLLHKGSGSPKHIGFQL